MMTPRLLTIQGQGRGETHSLTRWAKIGGIAYGTLITRLRDLGWDDEKAVFTPVKKGKQCKNEA